MSDFKIDLMAASRQRARDQRNRNFDRLKKLSDVAGVITRLGFLVAGISWYFKKDGIFEAVKATEFKIVTQIAIYSIPIFIVALASLMLFQLFLYGLSEIIYLSKKFNGHSLVVAVGFALSVICFAMFMVSVVIFIIGYFA